MLLKFFSRWMRHSGMAFFTIVAVLCIFGSIFVRDLDNSKLLGKIVDYTVSFENRFYDYRLKSSLNNDFRSRDQVLIKIDDYSLEKIGMWPIPRTKYAELFSKLQKFGVKVIALDILFPEKSPLIGNINPDKVLADSFRKFQQDGKSIFLAYTLAVNPSEVLAEAPVEMLNNTINIRNAPNVDFNASKINRFTFPIEELVATEVGLGNITASEDPDGIFRQYQLVANVDSIYYGSLGFNAFEAFVGEKHTIQIEDDGTGTLEIQGRKMEIYKSGETKIRYIGGFEQFPSVSFFDVLKAKDTDEAMKNLFDGKIVFVGSTALGAHDLRPSPVDSKMPGVFSHMNMAHMLLHGYLFQSTTDSVKYSLLILFLGMAAFILVQKQGNAFLDAGVVILLISICYFADRYYFMPNGYELKLFYCGFCLISSYSWNTFLKFYEANKEKKQIRGTFARYVAPTVVDEMLKDPDKLQVGGTKMDITCLFSDVRDFTRISEGLTATELAHSLNMYMGAMTDIVFDTKGTLDKYIGDAIVAIWGAPLPIGNHAQHAVEGAIKMMEVLPSINEEFRKLGRPEFNVGIGLNSGECSVGNMGSTRIFSYTALGDNMNLGARLESLCKYYGAQILISDMTLERLDLTNIKTRPIDKVIVKGKTTAVAIHEVLHSNHWLMKDQESLNLYLFSYKRFQARDFEAAYSLLAQLLDKNESDKPTKRLKELCRKYLDHPELVTDHFEVTTMTEK